MCVFNRDFSRILLLKKCEEKRKKCCADWGNVGGRVELGEKIIDACIREAKEEIGIDFKPEDLRLVDIKESPHLSEVHHAVHFVYVASIDEGRQILLNFDCDGESDEYRWFDLDDLPDKTLDSKEYLRRIGRSAKPI